MPDWSDPVEIVKDAGIFQKVCLVMLGIYTWEVITQLPYDWSVITRKREAHWPSFFYFYCKYSLWIGILCVNLATNLTTRINCQALYAFNQFAGDTAIGSASTLLMLRTIAVWNRAPLVTIPLVLASLGQWTVLFYAIATIRSDWSVTANACVVEKVPPIYIELIYLYTMSFDFIVLVLTTIGLVMSHGRSSLWQLVFRQGIIYFFVAFIANVVPTVFLLLNLNPIMNIMFTLPAAVASCIVACRSFVSLASFRPRDIYVHSSMPYSTTRVGSGAGDVIQIRAGGGVGTLGKKKGSPGNTIAGITFRAMTAGVDSMGQAYTMDELDTTRTTTTLACTDSKRGYDLGGTGHVMVHTETTVHDHDDPLEDDRVRVVDLERGESLSYGRRHGQKSFVPDI